MTETSFVSGVLAFAGYLLVIAAALRLSSREPALIVVAAAVAVYFAGLAALLASSVPSDFLTYSIVYWFFALCFLVVFGAIYKSLSLRMLLTLLDADRRSVSQHELAQQYIKRESFEDRLAILVDKGLSTKAGERFILTARGTKLASLVRKVQDLYRIEKSG